MWVLSRQWCRIQLTSTWSWSIPSIPFVRHMKRSKNAWDCQPVIISQGIFWTKNYHLEPPLRRISVSVAISNSGRISGKMKLQKGRARFVTTRDIRSLLVFPSYFHLPLSVPPLKHIKKIPKTLLGCPRRQAHSKEIVMLKQFSARSSRRVCHRPKFC